MYIQSEDIELSLKKELTDEQIRFLDELLIPGIESMVERETGRAWKTDQTYTEKLDGGLYDYYLANSPIKSVTSVEVDGVALSASAFVFYTNFVRIVDGAANGNQNVEIAYVCGSDIPKDLKMAMVRWVTELLDRQPEAGKKIKSKQVGPMKIEYSQEMETNVPGYLQAAIDRYRRIVL